MANEVKGNDERVLWRVKCREALSEHIRKSRPIFLNDEADDKLNLT